MNEEMREAIYQLQRRMNDLSCDLAAIRNHLRHEQPIEA